MSGSKKESAYWFCNSERQSLESGTSRACSTCINWKLFARYKANGPGSYESEKYKMQDLIFVATTIVFFAISIAYVHFCERVK
jgi:hypothetical protein